MCWVSDSMLICDHRWVIKDSMAEFIHTDSDLELPDVCWHLLPQDLVHLVKTISRKAHARVNLLSCKQSWDSDGAKQLIHSKSAGSFILSPLFINLYTWLLGETVNWLGLQYHQHADTHHYFPFSYDPDGVAAWLQFSFICIFNRFLF